MRDHRLAYRVISWNLPDRSVGALVPAMQGRGRFDNPKAYRMLYAADQPGAAVGEALADFSEWAPQLGHRFIATLSLPVDGFADLDDPAELARGGLRPSRVVWPERDVTQAIAGRLHREGRWIGVRWWSRLHSPWTLYALWSLNRARLVGTPEPLSAEHPAVRAAAKTLRVPL